MVAIDTIPFANMMYYQQPRHDNPQKATDEPIPRPILNQHVQQHVRDQGVAVNVQGVRSSPAQCGRFNWWKRRQSLTKCVLRMLPNRFSGQSHWCFIWGPGWNLQGERRGGKTDPIESNDPHWDTKIQMQEDPEAGVSSNVSHVLIIFKDIISKFRRPVHIGQVMVPVGCFIEGQPVPLTLPLESTPKMPEALKTSGLVHILAQTVLIGKGSGDSLKEERLPNSTKSVEEGRETAKSQIRL